MVLDDAGVRVRNEQILKNIAPVCTLPPDQDRDGWQAKILEEGNL
jgi:hypothetical protein